MNPKELAERLRILAVQFENDGLDLPVTEPMLQAAELLANLKQERTGKYAVDEVPVIRYVTPWVEEGAP